MKNLILPAFVILIGAGSAFATQNAKQNERITLADNGYVYNLTTGKCEQKSTCNAQAGEICTVGNIDPMTPGAIQVFGLDDPSEELSTCDIVLHQQRN